MARRRTSRTQPQAEASPKIQGAPGVPSSPAKKRIPTYPARILVNGSSAWNFSGLSDLELYPSPHDRNWPDGWVPGVTRDRMLRHHKIYQGINNWKNAVVGEGGRWVPAVNPYRKGNEQLFEQALEYTKLFEYSERAVASSAWETTRQLLDCIHAGNKIAPIVLRPVESGPFAGKWVQDDMTVWPNGTYEFYRDRFGKFVEVRLIGGMDAERYPREKFYVLSYRPINGNPYGTSVCDPLYAPFYADIQTDQEEMAYMAQWARPSIIIFASPPPEYGDKDAQPLYYANGDPIMEKNPDYDESQPITEDNSPTQQRMGYETEQNSILFQDFQSGSVWSMEHGALVQVVAAEEGGADLFRDARERNARNMTAVIMGTYQITESERNISSNNQEVSEGVVGLNVTEGKVMLEQADEKSIGRLLLEVNYPDPDFSLLPIRDYGSGQNGRLPKMMNATAAFTSNGSFDKAQWWDYCAGNGLPLPFPGAEKLIIQSNMTPRGSGGGDKSGQDKPAQTGNPTSND